MCYALIRVFLAGWSSVVEAGRWVAGARTPAHNNSRADEESVRVTGNRWRAPEELPICIN